MSTGRRSSRRLAGPATRRNGHEALQWFLILGIREPKVLSQESVGSVRAALGVASRNPSGPRSSAVTGGAARYSTAGGVTASRIERTIASGVMPSASPSKLRITRCRRAGMATARMSSTETLKRPSSRA